MSRSSGSLRSSSQIFAAFSLFALAATAATQCYQFSGPGVTLQIGVDTINFQTGPTFLAGGHTATYAFSGSNSFTLGGVTQTSQSIFDGAANIQYIPPSSPGGMDDASTFQMVVPNADPAGKGSHTWGILLAGNGDLIPSGLLPSPQALPPVSAWVLKGNVAGTDYNYIEVQSGAARTKYLLTTVGSCGSSGGGGGGGGSSNAQTLPHVADGNGFDTMVVLINTGTSDAQYALQYLDQSGNPVTYPLDPMQAGMTGTIHPGSEAIVRTTGSGPVTHLGWGQLTAPPAVKGMLIYQQQASATSFQEGSAPIIPTSQHFFFPFDNVGATTSIGFVNPSPTQVATVTFTARYESGGSDVAAAVNMNPLQQIAGPVVNFLGNTSGKRGLMEVNSNTPLGLVAFRFQGSAFTLFDTIAPGAAGAGAITSTIAHSADGNNFRSTFLLTNTGTVDAPYSLNILGATGQPQAFGFDPTSPLTGMVPAGSTRTLNTTGLGTQTNLGWAQLSAPPAVSGLEVFRQTNPGKSEQQATIPITQTNLAHFFVPFDNAANTTSIALANPDPGVPALLNVTLRFADGSSSNGQLTLQAMNYIATLLSSLFPVTTGKAGVAEFSSNVPVAVVEVRFNPTLAFTSLRAVGP
jgi:hypothetical protein